MSYEPSVTQLALHRAGIDTLLDVEPSKRRWARFLLWKEWTDTHLIENFHLQYTLVVSPKQTLLSSVPYTSCNFIGLEMPSTPDVIKHLFLLPNQVPITPMVLHRECLGAIDRCSNLNCASLEPNDNARVRGVCSDATSQNSLCNQRCRGEIEGERGAAINIR